MFTLVTPKKKTYQRSKTTAMSSLEKINWARNKIDRTDANALALVSGAISQITLLDPTYISSILRS